MVAVNNGLPLPIIVGIEQLIFPPTLLELSHEVESGMIVTIRKAETVVPQLLIAEAE